MTIFATAVISFLFGLAVGIVGYFLTTIAKYEKEIEDIFDSMCDKYQRKLDAKEEENERLSATIVDLQVKLAKKEGKK